MQADEGVAGANLFPRGEKRERKERTKERERGKGLEELWFADTLYGPHRATGSTTTACNASAHCKKNCSIDPFGYNPRGEDVT